MVQTSDWKESSAENEFEFRLKFQAVPRRRGGARRRRAYLGPRGVSPQNPGGRLGERGPTGPGPQPSERVSSSTATPADRIGDSSLCFCEATQHVARQLMQRSRLSA